jgi:hypothetical protein
MGDLKKENFSLAISESSCPVGTIGECGDVGFETDDLTPLGEYVCNTDELKQIVQDNCPSCVVVNSKSLIG